MSRERWNFWGMGTVFLSNIITRESNLRTAPARRIRESRTLREGASGIRVRLEDRSRRKSGAPKRAAQDRNKPGFVPKKELLPLFCVPVSVDRREAIPLFGEIFERENSGHGANRDAGATIDAFRRVDVELGLSLESRLILAGMNAVHRTDIHARGVFCADARLGNHVSHEGSPLFGQWTGGLSSRTAQPAKIPYITRLPGA